MDRTLISWNVPNMITVPLMAGIGFLVVALAWQLFCRATGRAGSVANDNASPASLQSAA